MTIALRTQQVIAHESGVVNTADPLGGSYFVEKLTNEIEAEALEYFRRIDAMGGMVAAIERGFPQREIQEAAFQFQQGGGAEGEGHRGRQRVRDGREAASRSSTSTSRWREEQVAAVDALKARRDEARVLGGLRGSEGRGSRDDNLMQPILEASRAYATLGEMCDALREVFGEYEEPPVF